MARREPRHISPRNGPEDVLCHGLSLLDGTSRYLNHVLYLIGAHKILTAVLFLYLYSVEAKERWMDGNCCRVDWMRC